MAHKNKQRKKHTKTLCTKTTRRGAERCQSFSEASSRSPGAESQSTWKRAPKCQRLRQHWIQTSPRVGRVEKEVKLRRWSYSKILYTFKKRKTWFLGWFEHVWKRAKVSSQIRMLDGLKFLRRKRCDSNRWRINIIDTKHGLMGL